MKSTLNIPMTVLSWELKKSSWRRKGEDDEDLDDDGRTRWKGLSLNNGKCSLFPLRDGVPFMKFRYRLTETGKVVRTLERGNVTRARRRLDKLVRMVGRGERTPEDAMHSFNSWKAHAMLGHSYHTIRRIRKCLQPIQSCLPTGHKRNASRS